MKYFAVSLVVLALSSAMPESQAAPPLPAGNSSPTKIEGYCGTHGGTYWPPGPESSTYGCILPDGSIVVCGGSLSGCDVIEAGAGLPPSKLPLAVIGVTLEVQTQTRLHQMQDKLDLLEVMVEDLGVLVEDVCEAPIFVP